MSLCLALTICSSIPTVTVSIGGLVSLCNLGVEVSVSMPYIVLMTNTYISAIVGMVTMILMFPIPGYLAKFTESASSEKMKKVLIGSYLASSSADRVVSQDRRPRAICDGG